MERLKYEKYFPYNFSIFLFFYFSIFPSISFADTFGGVSDLLTAFGKLVGSLIPLTFALAILFFFYGVAKFILVSGDPKAKTQGRNFMVWGIVAIFVISSVWGITNLIADELNLNCQTLGGFMINCN